MGLENSYFKNSAGFTCTPKIFLPLLFVLIAIHACTNLIVSKKLLGEACLDAEIERLDGLPEKQVLNMLDGQEINLIEFVAMSSFKQPCCSLPRKFYYWPNEVKEIYSLALEKKVTHQIRTYSNLMSTCYPERIDTGRIYGDVAEFYDQNGTFIGFTVYCGQGLYCPLPYSGYTDPSQQKGTRIIGERIIL